VPEQKGLKDSNVFQAFPLDGMTKKTAIQEKT